jgi:hypothetical protein
MRGGAAQPARCGSLFVARLLARRINDHRASGESEVRTYAINLIHCLRSFDAALSKFSEIRLDGIRRTPRVFVWCITAAGARQQYADVDR